MRGHVFRVTGVVLAVLMLQMSVFALAGPRGSLTTFNKEQHTLHQGDTGVFTIKPRVHLEPVTAIELTGGRNQPAISAGDYRPGGGSFNSWNLLTTVSRSVPELWRMRIPAETSLFALDVNYELVGANGRSSCLGNLEKIGSEIKVAIDEIPPRIIGREAHSMVVEGGMMMHLKLDTARSAGTYSGTLTVVVNQF